MSQQSVQRTPLTVTIEDDDGFAQAYVVRPYPAQKAAELVRRVIPFLEGPFVALVALKSDNAQAFGQALKSLASTLASEGDGKFAIELLQNTTRNGQKIDNDTFNIFYTLNLGEVIEAVAAVIDFNFSKVIARMRKPGGPLDRLVQKMFPPTPSSPE